MQKDKIKKHVYYYDIEQLKDFHSCHFISKNGKNEKTFVIHKSRNDIYSYLKFLREEVKSLIGFNNLNYDYPIIHYIMNDLQFYKEYFDNSLFINEKLYDESTRLINTEFSSVPYWKIQIPQLDIFRILHFDNPNNRCSLKKTEFVIRFNNVDDIDIGKIDYVTEDMIPKIFSYNRNDVLATKKVVENCKNDIELRKNISKLYAHYSTNSYKIDWMNFSDAKIGAEIFTVPLANMLNITVKELKQLRTHRDRILVKDIIFSYVNFKTEEFKEILNKFNKQHIVNTKKPFEFKKIFKGIEYVYGVGGLHACIKSGKYYADENYNIMEIDVASYYPNLAIRNKLYPEHLGEAFCEIYEGLFNQRMEAKAKAKKGEDIYYNKLIVSVFKLALNGSFGKGNDKHSFLFDRKFPMSITINGQLLLTMLVERLVIKISKLQIIYANTDGICFKIHKNDIKLMRNICKRWEKLTKLKLEEDIYKGIIVRDVNNYMKIKYENNLKPSQPKSDFYDNRFTKHPTKGCFEIVKTKNGKINYAKNWSSSIVQKALYLYYLKNKDIRRTILDCEDIFDFYLFHKNSKSPKTQTWIEAFIIYNKEPDNFIKMNKSIRYYISKDGGKLVKINTETPYKRDNICKGRKCTIANKHIVKNIGEYNIDYDYYIKECYKIINIIEGKFQLELEL